MVILLEDLFQNTEQTDDQILTGLAVTRSTEINEKIRELIDENYSYAVDDIVDDYEQIILKRLGLVSTADIYSKEYSEDKISSFENMTSFIGSDLKKCFYYIFENNDFVIKINEEEYKDFIMELDYKIKEFNETN